jgi:hypothetical protein
MKQLLLLITAFGLSFAALPAQTVPVFLNYQGAITDGNGNPLGSTGTGPNFTAAPTNRKMIFRIFNSANGTTVLWSEEQTVTVSLGQFSVLLGRGNEVAYTAPPAADPRPALHTVFTNTADLPPDGPQRFLEIIVDNGDGIWNASDQPITPRQRLTTTAYSFRAVKADTVADGAITPDALATGSVTADKLENGSVGELKLVAGSVTGAKLAPDSVTGSKIAEKTIQNLDLADDSVDSRVIQNQSIVAQDLANEAVTLSKIALNAVTTGRILDGTIANADLADGAVTAAKLNPASVGIWTVAGAGANVTRPTGNVGVGVANPTGKLQVDGDVVANTVRARSGEPGTGGSNFNGFAFTANAATGLFSPVASELSLYANNSEKMRVLANGNVGIGTSTPAVRLDVVGNADITMTEQPYNGFDRTFSPGTGTEPWRFRHWGVDPGATFPEGIATYSTRGHRSNDYTGTLNGGLTQMTGNVGIRTDSWIATRMGLAVYSDRRIKKEFRANSPAQDLAAIRQLKVTDYRMVDHADGGTTLRRGFIAQEVEKIIPGAVTRSSEFVPDIFSRATELDYQPDARTLHVTLNKDHHLKVGDAVRLHVDGERLDLNVSAVPSVRSFEVAECAAKPAAVFVYGRKVDDFRTVDYDRIFTTSVGALQELKKEKDTEILALQKENAGLLTRLAALEAKEDARESRLAAIEKQLSGQEDGIRTVTHKAGE